MSKMSVAVVMVLLMALSLSLAAQIPVSMIDNAFVPDSMTINPGDSVVWTNNGFNPHTSTSGTNGVPDELWNSGTLSHGSSFVRGFPTGGKFSYYCQFHYAFGMKGVIKVGTSAASELPTGADGTRQITCHPSPFSTSVTIRFAGTLAGRKRVQVFDVTGKLVRTLGETRGSFVLWDGRSDRGEEARPGVYLCRCGADVLAVTLAR